MCGNEEIKGRKKYCPECYKKRVKISSKESNKEGISKKYYMEKYGMLPEEYKRMKELEMQK